MGQRTTSRSKLNKKVIAIIDSDDKGENSYYPYVFTKYLKELEIKDVNVNLIIHHPEFEQHYGIKIKEIEKLLGIGKSMSQGDKKIFAAMAHFADEKNSEILFEEINGIQSSSINDLNILVKWILMCFILDRFEKSIGSIKTQSGWFYEWY